MEFIKYICSNKNNIYVYTEIGLYSLKYYNNKFSITETINSNKLDIINYLIKKKFSINNVIINCIHNNNFNILKILNFNSISENINFDIDFGIGKTYYPPNEKPKKIFKDKKKKCFWFSYKKKR